MGGVRPVRERCDRAVLEGLPAWAGAEVTGLRRYYNAALIAHPYNKWSDAERAGVDE